MVAPLQTPLRGSVLTGLYFTVRAVLSAPRGPGCNSAPVPPAPGPLSTLRAPPLCAPTPTPSRSLTTRASRGGPLPTPLLMPGLPRTGGLFTASNPDSVPSPFPLLSHHFPHISWRKQVRKWQKPSVVEGTGPGTFGNAGGGGDLPPTYPKAGAHRNENTVGSGPRGASKPSYSTASCAITHEPLNFSVPSRPPV